jgi:hypothetical protein
MLLPFICMCTCNLFPFGCNERLQLQGRPLCKIVLQEKNQLSKTCYFMFLNNWSWPRYNKKNVTIQSHYELNKLYFFHVENETNLNFPSIRHVPTNHINFTKSCWVTYYKSLCYIYNKIKYVRLHMCELCVPLLYMCVSMSMLLKT